MEKLLKVLIAAVPAMLAKFVVGLILAPLVMSMGFSGAKVADALDQVAALIRGETPTFTDVDEQLVAEGVVGMLSEIVKSYGASLIAAELEPLLPHLATVLRARFPET